MMSGSFFTFSLHTWEGVHSRNRLDKRGLTVVGTEPDLMSRFFPELLSAKQVPKLEFRGIAASAEPFRHQHFLKLIPLYQHPPSLPVPCPAVKCSERGRWVGSEFPKIGVGSAHFVRTPPLFAGSLFLY
jgi:hypothetical protein